MTCPRHLKGAVTVNTMTALFIIHHSVQKSHLQLWIASVSIIVSYIIYIITPLYIITFAKYWNTSCTPEYQQVCSLTFEKCVDTFHNPVAISRLASSKTDRLLEQNATKALRSTAQTKKQDNKNT